MEEIKNMQETEGNVPANEEENLAEDNPAEAIATIEALEEEAAETPVVQPKPKRKKRLRMWVRIMLSAIAAIVAFLLFMYIMGGAILQESYKLRPPNAEEVRAVMGADVLYKYLVAPYE